MVGDLFAEGFDDFSPTSSAHGAVVSLLGSLEGLLNMLGFDLSQAAEINIAKLTSRKERGTIGGDGDKR
jgi:hypothetical protein